MTDETSTHDHSSGTHRVVAAVLVREGTVLLCHRHSDRPWLPNMWDLPGGHVNTGETEQDALRRECHEELDITTNGPGQLIDVVDEPGLTLSVYLIDDWVGEPRNAATEEHDQIRWFHPTELATFELADQRYVTLFDRLLDVPNAPRIRCHRAVAAPV